MRNQTEWEAPAWHQALTLTERISTLHSANGHNTKLTLNTTLAERRLQRWRAQPPFAAEPFFTQRLALDGIDEADLRQLLGEPIKAVADRSLVTPTWLTALATAFDETDADTLAPMSSSGPEPSAQGSDLLVVCAPLIQQGRQRLRAGLLALGQAYDRVPFAVATVEAQLLPHLLTQLTARLNRTLALELNIARLQNLLTGDTPEARFQSFVQRLCDRAAALALLQEYPVLARQLTLTVERWVTTSLEFLQRLCADWPALQALFGAGADPGELVQIQSGLGDPHRGGRTVLIAGFRSGLRVVYKPRALAVDRHFQELLTWLNARGDHPPFRTLRILERREYGWMEFVAQAECHTVAELQRFYTRQGGYLALLYALTATDFHYENLIAAGEHPVLIDLEALFQPRSAEEKSEPAEQWAYRVLFDSVLGIGLLPRRLWSKGDSAGIDISGLGGAAGQLTPYGVAQWAGIGTDEMHLTRKQVTTRAAQNRPSLNGTAVDPLAYSDAILTGFRQVYALLLHQRDHLLAADGPIPAFAHDTIRVILRSTRTYGTLLRESFHPDVLRNALERDRLFDRLWSRVEQAPALAKVIAAERADLQAGDIPLFTTQPASHHLWSSANGCITNFFAESGLTLAQRRFQRLSQADLTQQLWLIQASLATLATDNQRAFRLTAAPAQPVAPVETAGGQTDALLAAARAVGDRLAALALHNGAEVAWLGIVLEQDHRWSLAPLGSDLYAGLPGVALFLGYLGALTQTARYTTLAQATIATLRRQIQSEPGVTAIGGFSGWGGVIYTLAQLGVLWQQPELLTEAEALVAQLPPLIQQDEQFDLIAGAAGCIGALLALYHCAPSPQTLAVAIQCGDHLLAQAQAQPQGIGWRVPFAPQPLAGLGHGAAGIAWALFQLAAVSGEPRFAQAAQAAITYERSLFAAQAGNWCDLRPGEQTDQAAAEKAPHFMTAWCHGAAGIGLARLQLWPFVNDSELRAEIEAALQTTLISGFGGNHSLCHGALGNLELLLQASTQFDPRWQTLVAQITAQLLAQIRQEGWRCGLPLRVESPGLMTGLAGIGYGLLRLAAPTRVPAVLVLAPPL